MFSNRNILRVGFVFLLSFGCGSLLIYFLEAQREYESRVIAKNIATSHAQSLEKQLSRALASPHALATVVKQNRALLLEAKRKYESMAIANSIADSLAQSLEKKPHRSSPSGRVLEMAVNQNITLPNFNTLAKELINHYGGITNLQLAPGGIVQQIYPLEGHEKAIGHDLNKNPYALEAIRSRKLTLEGPIDLIQGGVAILGRYPVFLPNLKTGEEEFWGFATALIDLSKLLEAVDAHGLVSNNYLFELSRVDTLTNRIIVFSKSRHSALEEPVTVDIEIPGGKWMLSVIPKAGWHSPYYVLLEESLVFVFSGLLCFFSYRHFRKANELEIQKNEYEIIFNSAPALIIYKDLQNNILRVNKAVADSFNLTAEEIEGKHTKEFYLDQYEKYYADDLEVIQSGEPKLGIVEPYKLESGETRWVQTNKVPYRDENGNIQGILLFALDITKQKEAENQVLDYMKKLEKANRELEDFSTIASHDLQEPLRKIIIFGDRLAEAFPRENEQVKDYLDRMQKAAARMQSLIDGLLKYAQVKTKFEPFQQVDLNKIIQDVLVDLETRIQNTKGTVKVGEFPTLEADPMQMHQLFQNLIGNALKFHREGVPPVVQLNASHERNGLHTITVEDNGIGIDETHIDKIFRPLERLHGKGEYEGTGMGLSICDKIISRHGGEITVKKNETGGMTFSFTLPEKQKTEKPEEPSPEESPPET